LAVKGLQQGLAGLGPMRLAAMAVVAIGTMGLLASVILMGNGGSGKFALLYADLDPRDASQVVDQLDRAHISHQVDGDGSRILVPADAVAQARLLLAKQGLPTGGSIGFEIFDRGDGMTASEFQQQINQTRAMEGELVRSILMITGVRGARVHLVLPHREPFARDQQEAQASVLLTMAGAGRLDSNGIQAILNLVAAAVPGLRPQNIAIIDSRGTLLARAGQVAGTDAAAQASDTIRLATEHRLSAAVEEMLERSLGPGHVQAHAAVEMDYQQTKEVQESYNPDGQVARSTQTVTDNSKSTEASPPVTVQNNLPNANASTPASGTSDQRQEETTNYEIGKVVRTVVSDIPQIRRVSIAVMVDGVMQRDADGKTTWHERPQEELTRIAALVRSAIGYDEKRGDHVEVVSMNFAATDADLAPTGPSVLGITLTRDDLTHLGETLVFGLIGVLTLLLVLRPMVNRLTVGEAGMMMVSPDGTARMVGADGGFINLPALSGSDMARVAREGGGALVGGGAGGALVPLDGEDDNMMAMANVEGAMRASAVRRITDLVDKHPEETVAIVRRWMLEGQMQ
jgi:flagellar M-ring protein FliF